MQNGKSCAGVWGLHAHEQAVSAARCEQTFWRRLRPSPRRDCTSELSRRVPYHQADASYLIIESSGISEPIQVAETFTQEFAETMAAPIEEIEAGLPEDKDQSPESRKRLAELIAAGGLSKVAKLDCCVSMVDCTTFMDDFDTTDFLTDRLGEEVDPQDERNITDLYVSHTLPTLRHPQWLYG